jgi:hypothetical protein
VAGIARYNVRDLITLDVLATSSVAVADEDSMAKKTTARSKPETAADAAPTAPAAKPRARTKAAKAGSDNVVTPQTQEPTTMSVADEPSEEDIRVRAYHRYLERGGGHGMDFEDWLEAQRELRKK